MKDSRFTPESVEVEDVQMTFTDDCSTSQAFVSVQQEGGGRILSQAQKCRKGLQTAQIFASLMSEDVKCNIHLITDTIRDTQNVDVHRVRKYVTSKGWLAVLSVLEEKENSE